MIKKRVLVLTLISILLIPNILSLYMTVNAAYTVTHNQVTINANSNNNNGIDAFPESYQIMLKKLVSDTGHENWKFKAFYTDIDWNELTSGSNENKCLRNTIYADTAESMWLCICNGEGDKGYRCASSKIVNYYLDPRNFLSETTIFQFLDLSNSSPVSVAQIKSAVEGTYLAGSVNGVSYAEMIYKAAEASGENALSIVVKIFQELGKSEDLPQMIAGKTPGYEGVYNFFNYGATDGNGNRIRGLEYAKNAGWTTPENALVEGAKLIANNYMKTGQNTKYTLKFDVIDDTKNGLYWHQYCTNVQDPNNQAKLLYNRYSEWIENDLTFVIPVYKNMPAYIKLPTRLTTNDGTLYFISTNYDNAMLRSEIGINNSALASLKRNQVVVMKNYNVNNSGWSQVANADGVVGYVLNEFLTPVNLKKDTYKVPDQPESDETPFSDISRTAWFYNAVEFCYKNNIIKGYDDGTFKPGNNITRGQLVTILHRIDGAPEVTGDLTYNDVNENAYYANSIKWASQNKIVNGYDDGTFKPDSPITRQQLAVMLCNYAKYKEIDVTADTSIDNFKDNGDVADYALDAIKWAIKNKIISGKEYGTAIDPTRNRFKM